MFMMLILRSRSFEPSTRSMSPSRSSNIPSLSHPITSENRHCFHRPPPYSALFVTRPTAITPQTPGFLVFPLTQGPSPLFYRAAEVNALAPAQTPRHTHNVYMHKRTRPHLSHTYSPAHPLTCVHARTSTSMPHIYFHFLPRSPPQTHTYTRTYTNTHLHTHIRTPALRYTLPEIVALAHLCICTVLPTPAVTIVDKHELEITSAQSTSYREFWLHIPKFYHNLRALRANYVYKGLILVDSRAG